MPADGNSLVAEGEEVLEKVRLVLNGIKRCVRLPKLMWGVDGPKWECCLQQQLSPLRPDKPGEERLG